MRVHGPAHVNGILVLFKLEEKTKDKVLTGLSFYHIDKAIHCTSSIQCLWIQIYIEILVIISYRWQALHTEFLKASISYASLLHSRVR